MSDESLRFDLESRYRSGLKRGLKKDRDRLKQFQSELNRRPMTIPVRLDFSGLKADMAKARQMMHEDLAEKTRILGPSGRPATSSGTLKQQAKEMADATKEVTRRMFDDKGELARTIRERTKQLGKGLETTTTSSTDAKSGKTTLRSEVDKDTRSLAAFNEELKKSAPYQQAFAKALGQGDIGGQKNALRKQLDLLTDKKNGILHRPEHQSLVGTSAYDRAENRAERLRQKLSGMEGKELRAQALADFNKDLKQLEPLQRQYKKALGQGDRSGQQSALRKQLDILENQSQGILNSSKHLPLIDSPAFKAAEKKARALREQIATGEGRELSDSEKTRRTRQTRGFERVEKAQALRHKQALDINSAELTKAKLIDHESARTREVNRLLGERRSILEKNRDFYRGLDRVYSGRGREDLAMKAFRRTKSAHGEISQFEKDTTKDSHKEDAKRRETQRKRSRELANRQLDLDIQDEKKRIDRRLSEIKAAENAALAKLRTTKERDKARAPFEQQRHQTFMGGQAAMMGFEQRAIGLDNHQLKKTARGYKADFGRKEVEMLAKHQAATRASGHAFDFHSSSLLRNAAAFARWTAAATVVLKTVEAISTGIGDMTKIDRSFATLQAVFRGTREEAQRLKMETLELAVEQGRSSEEAMDSAIRWSRLGLTRVQVLKATEASLVAANVAEVDAAFAAERLSSVYATYKLTVDDLPDVINKANAISNRYNVTNKDLFEILSRSAGVAKQMRTEMTDLIAIGGSVTGATGRPGGETGNALRYIMQQIGDPQKIEQLKNLFDFDVTDGTGDLKDMYTILSEMAELYPTLTSHEQAQFTQLIAGSRQADRFTKTMEGMATSQYLAAQAFADTNSAWNENEKIIESLDSKITALKSSWSELWVTIGDEGALDILRDTVEVTTTLVQLIEEAQHLDAKNKPSADIKLTDRTARSQLERDAGMGESYLTPERDFTTGQVRGAIANLRSLEQLRRLGREGADDSNPEFRKLQDDLTGRGGIGKWRFRNFASHMQSSSMSRSDGAGFGFHGKDFEDVQRQIEQRITYYESLIGEADNTRSTNTTTNARNRLNFLQRGADGFSGLARRVKDGAGSYDTDTALRDFDQFAELLLELKDGPAEFAKSYSRVRDKVKNGTAGPELDRLAGLFKSEQPEASETFQKRQQEEATQLRSELDRLDAARQKELDNIAATKTAGEDASKAQIEALEQVKSQTKTTSQALQQIEKGYDEVAKKGMSMKEALGFENYMQRSIEQARNGVKSIQSAMSGFGQQPLERSVALDELALSAPEAQLRRQMDQARRISDRRPGDRAAEDRLGRIRYRLNQLREENTPKREALEDALPGREVEDLMRRAATRNRTASRASLVGNNQSEQVLNQTRFSLTQMAHQGNYLAERGGQMSNQERAAGLGSVLESEATARKNILSLEERQYQIVADRKNLELELVEAQRLQTEEVSKRLMLASREDQLSAAAFARTTKDTKLSTDEFFFLGEKSRQNVSNFNPRQGPEILDNVRTENREKNRQLDRESDAISKSLASLRQTFETNEKALSRLMKREGFLPVSETSRIPEVRLEPNVQVSIQLASEFRAITEAVVRSAIAPEFSRIQQWVESRIPSGTNLGTNSSTGN